jgi:hypothetical protein
VPYWSKDPKKAARPVNARAETAHEKPMFRKLIREHRCLIPANCYYEWKEMPVGKRPHCIRMEDESLFLGRKTRDGASGMADARTRIKGEEGLAMKREQVFAEFRSYWETADELLHKATKEQLSAVARILALQSALYARTYGRVPLPKLFELLKISEIGDKELELLLDGTATLVGVLASVTGGPEEEPESPMQ